MSRRANAFVRAAVAAAVCALLSAGGLSHAAEGESYPGEDRWIPSFAIVSGVTAQKQKGKVESFIIESSNPVLTNMEPTASGDTLVVSPFVGGNLEIMTPTWHVPGRPRFFLSGEVLPTFATERDLATQGQPGCIRGPAPGLPCARDEDGTRRNPFTQDLANGRGSVTSAQIERWVFGATIGAAFPFEFNERKLLLKPSFGWINYKVRASGLVVGVRCNPTSACTDYTPVLGQPPRPGFFREMRLSQDERQRFNGIGPGLDLEMQAARYGPIGASLVIGARAYYIVDDEVMRFSKQQAYSDQAGDALTNANWRVKVDDWMYRGHVGIRFSWLGED